MGRRNGYRRRRLRILPLLAGIGRQMLRVLKLGLFLALLAGVSLALIAAYNWVISTEHLAVEDIRITGNRRLGDREILNVAGVSRGDNILALSIASVEGRLSQNPWVKRVLVRRELPDRLIIKLTEREAVYWVQQGEAVHYADEQGRSIAPVGVGHFVSLPMVDMRRGSSRHREVLTELTRLFSDKSFPFSLAEVGWIDFLCEEIIQIFLYDRDMTVRLSAAELDKNSAGLRRVWRDLVARQELEKVDRIMAMGGDCWVRFPSEQTKD